MCSIAAGTVKGPVAHVAVLPEREMGLIIYCYRTHLSVARSSNTTGFYRDRDINVYSFPECFRETILL